MFFALHRANTKITKQFHMKQFHIQQEMYMDDDYPTQQKITTSRTVQKYAFLHIISLLGASSMYEARNI